MLKMYKSLGIVILTVCLLNGKFKYCIMVVRKVDMPLVTYV